MLKMTHLTRNKGILSFNQYKKYIYKNILTLNQFIPEI